MTDSTLISKENGAHLPRLPLVFDEDEAEACQMSWKW